MITRRTKQELLLFCSRKNMSSLPHKSAPRLLQEVIAKAGHFEAAAGFALACAMQERGNADSPHLIVWVRQDEAVREGGTLYGPGLATLGIDAGNLLVVHARTLADTLRAGLEVVRCPSVAIALIETVSPVDLTASRRLKLAAEKSHVAPMLIRHVDVPMSNAVRIRWRVQAASCRDPVATERWPPIPRPAFDVELVKHPAGLSGMRWCVEWDHVQQRFEPSLPLPLAAVPIVRPMAA